tara:strand:- start:1758 stop:1958 length:201 start_codon:yes stop_codon:yes gene_type:complete
MIERLLDRLYRAVAGSDSGVPTSVLRGDMLKAVNMALSRSGGGKLKSLDDEQSVRRAVTVLEREAQ